MERQRPRKKPGHQEYVAEGRKQGLGRPEKEAEMSVMADFLTVRLAFHRWAGVPTCVSWAQ